MAAIETIGPIPWWKEPTKDQWTAWVAAWLGWTLDAFDFTIFPFLMVPIASRAAKCARRCSRSLGRNCWEIR